MEQVAYDILAYLAENPDAQDTQEGVAGWWLSGQTIKPNMAVVEGALARLVNKGLVIARGGECARIYYKVDRRRLEEISAMLARFESSDAASD